MLPSNGWRNSFIFNIIFSLDSRLGASKAGRDETTAIVHSHRFRPERADSPPTCVTKLITWPVQSARKQHAPLSHRAGREPKITSARSASVERAAGRTEFKSGRHMVSIRRPLGERSPCRTTVGAGRLSIRLPRCHGGPAAKLQQAARRPICPAAGFARTRRAVYSLFVVASRDSPPPARPHNALGPWHE